jgi:predicted RecA/RadA family phage recombinase|tara:strand:- start:2873 stop:3319 length:447 start_codon:yes stop_codon:yes gene_type:complete
MAQTGFVLSDEGRSITILNDSGTTAIEAGDLVFSIANDDVLTQTAASARNTYAANAIKGKSMTDSASGYQTILGVALEDIPADGYGALAMEGVFIHQTDEDVEAGGLLQGDEAASNKVAVADEFAHKIGYALTGGSADTEHIIWKLSK